MPEQTHCPELIVAINDPNEGACDHLTFAAQQAGILVVKYGLQVITARGQRYCANLAERYGLNWMCDLKGFDTPDTIHETVENLANLALPPAIITIPVASGRESLAAAKVAASRATRIFGVTVLSSMTEESCKELHHRNIRTVVYDFSRIAAEEGMAGVTCPVEYAGIVRAGSPELRLLSAGIRPQDVAHHNHVHVATPAQAVKFGVDYLVVGRPITQMADQVAAGKAIKREVDEVAKSRVVKPASRIIQIPARNEANGTPNTNPETSVVLRS